MFIHHRKIPSHFVRWQFTENWEIKTSNHSVFFFDSFNFPKNWVRNKYILGTSSNTSADGV